MTVRSHRYFLIALLFLLAGCGKKGPLIPPEALVPAPVDNLKVEQKSGQFFVSWSPPTREVGGKLLSGLAGFKVYRREVLPPGEDCEECPTAYRLIKSVDLDYLQDVSRFDNLYIFADRDLTSGTTYQYKLVSFKKDGTESATSNRARLKMLPPPPAPRLTARDVPGGVLLQWEPGPGSPAKGEVGYNLYRRQGNDFGSLTLLTSTPLKERQLEDVTAAMGVTYVYTVRAVIQVDGETVEGGVSNEASIRRAPAE